MSSTIVDAGDGRRIPAHVPPPAPSWAMPMPEELAALLEPMTDEQAARVNGMAREALAAAASVGIPATDAQVMAAVGACRDRLIAENPRMALAAFHLLVWLGDRVQAERASRS